MQTAKGRGADAWTRPGVRAQGCACAVVDAIAVALAGPASTAAGSWKRSLHGFNGFLRPLKGIGLFMMLQLLKCMTNT